MGGDASLAHFFEKNDSICRAKRKPYDWFICAFEEWRSKIQVLDFSGILGVSSGVQSTVRVGLSGAGSEESRRLRKDCGQVGNG